MQPSAKQRRLAQLIEDFGERVALYSADIGDAEQLRDLLLQVCVRFGAISTVIHAAGVDASMHYRLMTALDPTFVSESFYAKQYGLNALASLAEEFRISHCHVISSISSAIAGLGMFVYGGIHGFVDAFVEQQRALGTCRWTSVAWEAWDTGENGEDAAFQQGAFGSHLDSLAVSPETGIQLIKAFWTSCVGQVIVSTGDLNQRYDQWVEGRLESIDPPHSQNKDSRPELQVEFLAPRTEDEKRLCRIWSDLLAIDVIGINDSFFELGGHSLLALKLVQLLKQEFGQTLSIVDMFDCSTVRKQAERLLGPRCPPKKEPRWDQRLQARKAHVRRVAKTRR
ncbi:MAG: KR domain-containing protein [Chlamydiia bacterium]|nr:KR domain-containing protein [Chlamydiia bacterium]